MRSLLLSLMIIGLLFVSAAPALADDDAQSQNATATTAAYLTNATGQATVMPVARFYYGGPGWRGWYGYRTGPGTAPTTPLITRIHIHMPTPIIRVGPMDMPAIIHTAIIIADRECSSVSDIRVVGKKDFI